MRLPILVLTGALLTVLPATAQNVYKYRNEQGEWVFTDRKPQTGQEFEQAALPSNTTGPVVKIERRDTDVDSSLLITNEFFGPVELGVFLTDLVNVTSGAETRGRFLIPSRSSSLVLNVVPRDPAKPWDFDFEFHGALGDPDAEHRPESLYRVPFARATQYRVSQAYPGGFTHKDSSSEYAIDFAMPEGTQIYTARGGVVIDIATNFFSSGTDLKKDGQRANLVRILHDDGTMAIYAHLLWESIRVKPGQRVERGQFIAKSGNTGFSSGPHLHFDVHRNAGMRLISIPVQFQGARGAAITPKTGAVLTAY